MEREFIIVNVFSNQHKKEIEHIIFVDEIKFISWMPGGKAMLCLGPGLFINTEEGYGEIQMKVGIRTPYMGPPVETKSDSNIIPMQRPEP